MPLKDENFPKLKNLIDKIKSLNKYNKFALILFATITLLLDYRLWYFGSHHVFKATIYLALGLMLFLNLVSFFAIAHPLSEKQEILPLFGPNDQQSGHLYSKLFVDGTASAAKNSLHCLFACLCLLGVRAVIVLLFIEDGHPHQN